MTEREMLVLAAKAAGIEIRRDRLDDPMARSMLIQKLEKVLVLVSWNPRSNSGDALELATHLRFKIVPLRLEAVSTNSNPNCVEIWQMDEADRGGDPLWSDYSSGLTPIDAMRQAITRAAAELGRKMP